MGLDRLQLGLAVGAALGLGAFVSLGAPLTNSANGRRDCKLLIERIERQWPVGVKRDAESNVISVILPVKEVTDENVFLLTNVTSLTSIGFSWGRVTRQPSAAAVQSLQHAPNLRALAIQCSGEIPPDVFGGLLKLTQLEALTFTATWPPKETGYTPLKELPRLQSLTLYWPGLHLEEAMSTLLDLNQLKNLEIFRAQLDETNYYPLLNHRGLTNLNVDSGSWTLKRQRKPRSRSG